MSPRGATSTGAVLHRKAPPEICVLQEDSSAAPLTCTTGKHGNRLGQIPASNKTKTPSGCSGAHPQENARIQREPVHAYSALNSLIAKAKTDWRHGYLDAVATARCSLKELR